MTDFARFSHDHADATSTDRHESRTRWVVLLTCAMMVGELVVGYLTGSMALTADGWHMATHAGALGMAAFAYWFARTRSRERSFSFGTGKVHALAGYTSAVALAFVALWMIGESLRLLLHPVTIHFREALPVAVLGLVVNLVSVRLLHVSGDEHDHHDHHDEEHDDHDDGHEDDDDHGHHDHGDHNLRAAYVHVMADAFTSVLAILALVCGRYLGWTFLDPAMGVVGGVVILRWGFGLCKRASRQLLDMVPSQKDAERIRSRIEAGGEAHVVDLHLWEVGLNRRGCIVSIVSGTPRTPAEYRALIDEVAKVHHLTVEVHAS